MRILTKPKRARTKLHRLHLARIPREQHRVEPKARKTMMKLVDAVGKAVVVAEADAVAAIASRRLAKARPKAVRQKWRLRRTIRTVNLLKSRNLVRISLTL